MVAALQVQIGEVRHRLGDKERSAGLADIARAPISQGEFRRSAGRRA
jgi:hypothetical protein